MLKRNFSIATSEAIEDALGQRLENLRLSRNITQADLAREAGVSRSTITRLVQEGKGISLDSFIRIVKALGLAERLDSLVPSEVISPLERLERKNRPPRQRARSKKSSHTEWTWKDES